MEALLSPPLGRFLEISISTPVIRESLEFYESLGFVQAAAGETWSHPYAVVTDGRLFIGLHGREMSSPSLTFVLPQLQLGVSRLKELGVAFEDERFGDDVFNQALLRDPGGLSVLLLEARTFSPPQLDAPIESCLRLLQRARYSSTGCRCGTRVLESIGFVALDEEPQPFPADTVGQRRSRPGAVSHARTASSGADIRGRRNGAAADAAARAGHKSVR
jgi:hypothetical protein